MDDCIIKNISNDEYKKFIDYYNLRDNYNLNLQL